MQKLLCCLILLAFGCPLPTHAQSYRYWLIFYGFGGTSVPITPGAHSALDYTDVYPGVGEDELHIVHHTANAPENYLSLELSRDHARAFAAPGATLVVDPCYSTPAADGLFTIRATFLSDAQGGVVVHATALTMNGAVAPGFAAFEVKPADYPALAALLNAYAAGDGTYLTLAFDNGGENYRDVDFGIYNARIDSSVLTPVFLGGVLPQISSNNDQWTVVLPKSTGYTDYVLERSDNLQSWVPVGTKHELWGPLTWQVPKQGDREFFRVRVGSP